MGAGGTTCVTEMETHPAGGLEREVMRFVAVKVLPCGSVASGKRGWACVGVRRFW